MTERRAQSLQRAASRERFSAGTRGRRRQERLSGSSVARAPQREECELGGGGGGKGAGRRCHSGGAAALALQLHRRLPLYP